MAHLVATPGAVNANSYITLADATTYLTTLRLYADAGTVAWTTSTDDTKDAALIWATALLDHAFEWVGIKRTLEQSLRWPRSGAYDRDYFYLSDLTVPLHVQHATAELALWLLQQDPTTVQTILGGGLSELRIDVIELKVSTEFRPELIPQHVRLMLYGLGVLLPTATRGDKVVRLLRT